MWFVLEAVLAFNIWCWNTPSLKSDEAFRSTLTLINQEKSLNTCIQSNGTRHWIFLRAFDKVGPAHIVQYLATHFSTSIFQLTGRRLSQFALPSHFPNASCTADCRVQFTPQKELLLFTNRTSLKSTPIFCPSKCTTEKANLFVTVFSSPYTKFSSECINTAG